jgi:hypothetical protein
VLDLTAYYLGSISTGTGNGGRGDDAFLVQLLYEGNRVGNMGNLDSSE